MSKIRTRKQLQEAFLELTDYEKKSFAKKTFTLKDYNNITEIISKTPLKNVKNTLIKYLNTVYLKKKQKYIIWQILGLLIVVGLTAVIFFHLVPVKQLWVFIAWVFMILIYLILDNLAYRNSKKMISKAINLANSFASKKD